MHILHEYVASSGVELHLDVIQSQLPSMQTSCNTRRTAIALSSATFARTPTFFTCCGLWCYNAGEDKAYA